MFRLHVDARSESASEHIKEATVTLTIVTKTLLLMFSAVSDIRLRSGTPNPPTFTLPLTSVFSRSGQDRRSLAEIFRMYLSQKGLHKYSSLGSVDDQK